MAKTLGCSRMQIYRILGEKHKLRQSVQSF
ncbi:hypothetical protein [Chelativorans sp. ZYF759]